MKSLKYLFTVPKNEKVSEKHMMRVLISTVCGVLLCMTCLVSTTWAWFAVSITSEGNVVEIGQWEDPAVISDETAESTEESTQATEATVEQPKKTVTEVTESTEATEEATTEATEAETTEATEEATEEITEATEASTEPAQ